MLHFLRQMNMLLLALLVCSCSSSPQNTIAEVSEAASLPVLTSDDECQETDGSCALNALQRASTGRSSASAAGMTGGSELTEMQEAEQESSQGHIITLYHQTSPSIGKIILQSGFKPGRLGWCGGGIYFAMTPKATTGKIKGPNSHHGFMIEAKVDVGRIKHMGWSCTTPPTCNHHPFRNCQDKTNRGPWLKGKGYDSIAYTPDPYGQEIVIYNPKQVISMKGYAYR